MEYEDLVRLVLDLKRQLEDHKHTGIDSQIVEFELENQGTINSLASVTIDGTYDSDEVTAINNLRSRSSQIEAALIAVGILE